jgi:hypothetical protein
MKKIYLLFVSLLFISCNKKISKTNTSKDANYRTVTYQKSTKGLVNPGRGFMRVVSTHTSHFVSLNKQKLMSYRNEQIIPGTNYSVASSLIQRIYILDNFKNGPISEAILQKINEDFKIARKAGVKLVLRFNYTVSTHGGCSENRDEGRTICPPYGDAPLPVVLEQIKQLKPILQNNADVIAVVQEGFIGIWGESYYTDYFGDIASTGRGYTDSDWAKRNKVKKALLDALPKDRMIQVRTPQEKQRFIDGVHAPITAKPMTEADAFNGSDKARIGFFNDAFLANPMSGGFEDRGNSITPRRSGTKVTKILRNYTKSESNFVVMGGETDEASINNPRRSSCGPEGDAENVLKAFHYDYLNSEWYKKLLENWVKDGCFETIKRKLGYRFVLEKATLPTKIKPGSSFIVKLDLENVGYSSPYNPRPVKLIFRNSETHKTIAFKLNTDIRKWFPGKIKIKDMLTLPKNMVPGKYKLFLDMPDKDSSIPKRPEYSIRLANTNIWEDSTGYNRLNTSVEVK